MIQGDKEIEVLNEHQKRSLTVTFRAIEETLNRLERLIRSEREDHLMYAIHNPYTLQEREAILQRFASIRTRLAEGQRTLQLGKVNMNLRSIITAEMSVFWEHLVDSLADKLKRYGEVHSEAKRVVDQLIEELIRDVLDILKIGESKRSSGET